MNYSINANIRRNDGQYYQTGNNRAVPPQWYNGNPAAMRNIPRNIPPCNFIPFSPNQPIHINPGYMLPSATNKIPPMHGNVSYQPGSNVYYGGYGGTIPPPPVPYNQPENPHINYPVQNNGPPSWSIPSNNAHYDVHNHQVNGNVEPVPDTLIPETNSETEVSGSEYSEEDSDGEEEIPIDSNNPQENGLQKNETSRVIKWSEHFSKTCPSTNNGFSNSANKKIASLPKSNVQSSQLQSFQNTKKNSNYSSTMESEQPSPALKWSSVLGESITDKFPFMSLNTSDLNRSGNTIVVNTSPSIDPETSKDIMKSVVAGENQKKKLLETMKNINPQTLSLDKVARARYFIIKSYSEDDLHRAIKYGVWCSTEGNNVNLNKAFKELRTPDPKGSLGRLFLFFSINGSGFFSGIAEMTSEVESEVTCGFWTQKRWKGRIFIRWHYVKDVPNNTLRHIRSDANDKKPATNSRDGTEVSPTERGREFIKVFHQYKHLTSLFDDFVHYEKKQPNPKQYVQFPQNFHGY